jgi:carboxyl-terminal processing protease
MKKVIFVSLLLLLFVSLGFKYYDDDFELVKNIEIFQNVMKQLKVNYVNNIDSRKLITTAIDKMLETLDPYTVYYPQSKVEDILLMSDARYIGIGITIDTNAGNIYIVDILKSGSAAKAGLQIGDKIVKLNGISTKQKDLDDIHNLMIGQAGSYLTLAVKRNGKILHFKLKRQVVDIDVVSYHTDIDSVGYIKLDNFSDKSYSEFQRAFKNLKKENIKGLIIDLRDNPGGLLNQAVDIVNMFLPKGLSVVTSRGKSNNANKVFFTKNNPVDTKIPIVVLVNRNSASASEIVAGTLQDYDRAVILGERTFGKGLVQQIFDLGYDSKIKITVSKYYIPSGRCIQAIDYSHGEDGVVDTSLNFYTSNGRIVHEGSGIYPDIFIKTDTLNKYVKYLVNKYFIFNFCTQYYTQIDTSNCHKIDDIKFENYSIFKKYLTNQRFIRDFGDIKSLNSIEKSTRGTDEMVKQIEQLKNNYEKFVLDKLSKNKNQILYLINDELVKRRFLHSGEIKFSLKYDKAVKMASKILKNKKKYDRILAK